MDQNRVEYADHWKARFRHSAGRLGSVFLTALSEGMLIGWRAEGSDKVVIPPRESGGPGDWIELAGKAELLGLGPEPQREGDGVQTWLAWVALEGADTPVFTRLHAKGARPRLGTVLRAVFDPDRQPRFETLAFVPEDRPS